MLDPLPIYILGGSDSRPGPVPKGLDGARMLRGCKGAIELPSGRCLAQELILRIRASDRFMPPVIVGPRGIYEDLVDCPIVDVEGNLADTLAAVRAEIRQRSDLSQPIAFTTCDILPNSTEFQELIDTCYRPNASCSLWGQLVTASPLDMGASDWKPAYKIEAGNDNVAENMTYPGHLLIARPVAIRIRLMNHLLQLAYRHRNLSLIRRPLPMITKGIGRLLLEDIKNLGRGQAPVLSISIPWHGAAGFFQYRRGKFSPDEFSRRVMKVLLHRDFHQTDPPAVVFSTTSIRSFAKDIDTEGELEELIATLT